MPGARIEVNWTWSSITYREQFPYQKTQTQKKRYGLDFKPFAPTPGTKTNNLTRHFVASYGNMSHLDWHLIKSPTRNRAGSLRISVRPFFLLML
jgi:hypothetical protein